MKDFILNNYHWLSILIVDIFLGVLFLIKKVKVIMKDTSFEKVISLLPSLIIKAEKSGKSGPEKKVFVLGSALSYLADLTGKDLAEVGSIYSKKISDYIEVILSTPVKKGLKDED